MNRFVLALLPLLFSAPALAQTAHLQDVLDGCVPCHGPDGVAKDRAVPNIAGQNIDYLYNQLVAFQNGSRKHKEMRIMTRNLTKQELESISDYFSNLPPR